MKNKSTATNEENNNLKKRFIQEVESCRAKIIIAKERELRAAKKLMRSKTLLGNRADDAIKYVNNRFEAYMHNHVCKSLERIAFDLQIKLPSNKTARKNRAVKKLKANHNM